MRPNCCTLIFGAAGGARQYSGHAPARHPTNQSIPQSSSDARSPRGPSPRRRPFGRRSARPTGQGCKVWIGVILGFCRTAFGRTGRNGVGGSGACLPRDIDAKFLVFAVKFPSPAVPHSGAGKSFQSGRATEHHRSLSYSSLLRGPRSSSTSPALVREGNELISEHVQRQATQIAHYGRQ